MVPALGGTGREGVLAAPVSLLFCHPVCCTWQNSNETQKFWDVENDYQQLVACRMNELSHLEDYRLQVFYLVQAVKQQVNEAESASVLGIQRSQQYQDRLTSNREYLPQLEDRYKTIKYFTDIKGEEVKGLQEAENVARTDHPRHVELAWSFCYTNSCSIHRSSKERSGYWPRKRKSVYWEEQRGHWINSSAICEM
jgi:hypothetical protein